MAMNEWDRDYVEHLIRRDIVLDAQMEADAAEAHADYMRDMNAYHWNVRFWESVDTLSGRCPDCGSLLVFNRDDIPTKVDDPRDVHEKGCPVAGSDMDQRLDDLIWLADNPRFNPSEWPGQRELSYSELVMYRILKPTSQRKEADLIIAPAWMGGILVRQLMIAD